MKYFILIFILNFFHPNIMAATIQGQIFFKGMSPNKQIINTSSDVGCQSNQENPIYLEDIILNDNGTLFNTIIFIKEETLKQNELDTEKNIPSIQLNLINCQFVPHILTLKTQQSLIIVNHDNTLHKIESYSQDNPSFEETLPLQGMSIEKKFNYPEIPFLITSSSQPWMKSYIAIFNHPYFAQSDIEGKFQISNIPPGTYLIEAWHETLGSQTQMIQVEEKSETMIHFTFESL